MTMDLLRTPLGPWVKLRDGRQVHLWQMNLDEIREHRAMLECRGVYERLLLLAFMNTNHAHWSLPALRELFQSAERGRLRAAGDSLPGPGPFTVYRGVAGQEPTRRVHGLSWTANLERAREFAERFDLPEPGVYRITVKQADVLAYVNAKEEEEFIVLLPPSVEPQRIE